MPGKLLHLVTSEAGLPSRTLGNLSLDLFLSVFFFLSIPLRWLSLHPSSPSTSASLQRGKPVTCHEHCGPSDWSAISGPLIRDAKRWLVEDAARFSPRQPRHPGERARSLASPSSVSPARL
ncbi:hypothetical protein BCV70DRAFT_199736 [Testicularia cyperi]|uniref:Uncharacterized protein n=1 Tax=Testicularia cyperi TaxID=1882483 RepID=A0A317XRE5_9BASI|nr:hypothetical protein BCV70DRAFT_199736 [Testicularia cyperi]